ncbi:hypothetical protein [Pseudonocardia yunnanensis]|uniref:Uncharacterized protein n=1 Tax=Pseudonocardia yunnanensis TaxID=58107 RepID=A0ABW4EY59_9PSEU
MVGDTFSPRCLGSARAEHASRLVRTLAVAARWPVADGGHPAPPPPA